MSSLYTLPVSANTSHAHHGHGHTRSHHRKLGPERLPPPYTLARIPSESVYPRSNDAQASHENDAQEHFLDGNRRYFHANAQIPAPLPRQNGSLNGKPKAMLPFCQPSSEKQQANGYGAPVVAYHEPSHTVHTHRADNPSRFTTFLLPTTQRHTLLHSVLIEKDSRRIFYFMSLNFAFMLVQLSYGFVTGSLGLLSDSIHMFFDCLALAVGLSAAVMSKWPPSVRFPYGYGKVDTLAGFANGIFLMIISIEIVTEAIERLTEGSQMQRLGELLVVSATGLAVNLVGIFAFGHAHHGHDHSHGGHSHDSQEHQQDEHSMSASPSKSKKAHSHLHHHHGNENMQGIYLHILADTMGSVAVIISTTLVYSTGWAGFDPLASCVIAILIFASAIPLVSSSAKTLLLTLPADVEYSLRDTLAGVSSLRGVAGYSVPKFWLDDVGESSAVDHHTHGDHHHGNHHTEQHSHGENHSSSHDQRILGVIHVVASRGANIEDVRERTVQYLQSRNMDVVVQVDREGEGKCWCGGGVKVG